MIAISLREMVAAIYALAAALVAPGADATANTATPTKGVTDRGRAIVLPSPSPRAEGKARVVEEEEDEGGGEEDRLIVIRDSAAKEGAGGKFVTPGAGDEGGAGSGPCSPRPLDVALRPTALARDRVTGPTADVA